MEGFAAGTNHHPHLNGGFVFKTQLCCDTPIPSCVAGVPIHQCPSPRTEAEYQPVPEEKKIPKSSHVPGRNAGRAGLGVVRRGGAGLVAPLGVGAKPLRSVLGREWPKPASSYVAGLSRKPINGVVQKSHTFKVRSNPCARRVARPRRPLPAVCSRECPQVAHPRGEAPRGGPRRPRAQKAEEQTV